MASPKYFPPFLRETYNLMNVPNGSPALSSGSVAYIPNGFKAKELLYPNQLKAVLGKQHIFSTPRTFLDLT